MALKSLRREFTQANLSEESLPADPVTLFSKWFDEAVNARLPEPYAMSVATVDPEGRPSSRILLIKEYDQNGFTWFNNYDSRKGQDLNTNNCAAMLFFWPELERQVRIEGQVERVSDAENDAYFHSRPLQSRLGAIASVQSQPVKSREEMEVRYAEAVATHGDAPLRPSSWGGYRLIPDRIEFWQGRRLRFHDRILFIRQQDGSWQHQRLQP
jgi:pyridoxamine 5'-phosphate oxidase